MTGCGRASDWYKGYGVLVDSLTTLSRGQGERARIFGRLLNRFYWDLREENRKRTGFSELDLVEIYEARQFQLLRDRCVDRAA